MEKATLSSQLESAPCLLKESEEMFWLQMNDDFQSKVRLGNLYSGQYRYKDAIQAFQKALQIKEDISVYAKLAGAHLTLRHFDEAKRCYQKCIELTGSQRSGAFGLAIWSYFQQDYSNARAYLKDVMPCEDEMLIALMYWDALAALKEGKEPELLADYHPNMHVGHHTAYEQIVQYFNQDLSLEELCDFAKGDPSCLNQAILYYGISVIYESQGQNDRRKEFQKATLACEDVWPCISYLACYSETIEE
jgi:tetratricopeptide (TPR) repeat protein